MFYGDDIPLLTELTSKNPIRAINMSLLAELSGQILISH